MMQQNLRDLISRNREIQELVTSRGTSKNPLDIFREKGYKFHVMDLEINDLHKVKQGKAGYRTAFNPVTGESLGSGTSLIKKAKIIQFSMGQGVPGSEFSPLYDFVAQGVPKNASFWSGHDPRLMAAVKQGKLQPGMEGVPYAQMRSRIQEALGRLGPKDIVVGHNILNADITWLKQSGVDVSNLRALDTMSIAGVLANEQGYTGGLKLESLAARYLGKGATSHLASEDIVQNFNVLNAMFSPENWEKYSAGQKQQVWDLMMPLLSSGSTPVQAGGYSTTASYLHSATDPMRYRQMKFTGARAATQTADGRGLRTLTHSGSKRGAKAIYERLYAFDPVGAKEFRALYKYFSKHSNGRISFALEQRNGLEYLNLYASKKGGAPIGDAISIPMVQSKLGPSAITYKGSLRATRGRFSAVLGKNTRVDTTMTGLFLSQIRARLYGSGGIDVGKRTHNITFNYLKALVANAEKSKVFYGGSQGLTRNIRGRAVGAGSLITAIHNLKVGPEFGYNIPAAMAGEVQFVKPGVRVGGRTAKELPGLAELKETLVHINVNRAREVQTGKGNRAYNSFDAIKEPSTILLNTLKGHEANILGVKHEAIDAGVFRQTGSSLHFGLSNKAIEKGTYHLKGIQPITDQRMLHGLRGFKSPMLMPSGLVNTVDIAKRITRAAGAGGRYSPMMGATMRVSMLYGGDAGDVYRYFGDPGLRYTESALPFLQKPGTPRSVFARDLNTDLLKALSPEQYNALQIDKRLDTSTLGRVNYSGSLGFTDQEASFMRPGESILDIKYNKAAHGYDIKLGAGLTREYETSLLVGTRRTTAFAPIEGFAGSQFVGHSMFFDHNELLLHHSAAQIHKSGLNKEYHRFLEDRFGPVARSRDYSMIGVPDVEQNELLKANQLFAKQHGISIDPRRRAVSGGVPGQYALDFDLPVFQRYAADQDLGYRAGNALRLRLDAVKEMAMMEGFLGLKENKVSKMLGRIHSVGTYDRLNEFKFGLKLMSSKATGVRQKAAELGLDVLSLSDIRGGALSPTSLVGDKTRESIAGSYLDKYLNKGFILDLESDIGMLPMGMKGKKHLTSYGNRFVYIPSAKMAGFGINKGGFGQVSKGRPYGKFAEVINLIAHGKVSSNQVARRLYTAYESFERTIFGKNKAFESKLLTTHKLKSSASMRLVPQRSQGMGLFEVDVDLKWLGENKRKLGITDDFLAKIARGEDAFGYMEISPHQRPGHATLVKFKQAKTGSVLSRGLGISQELLYGLERDVDKDAARILFLDTAKGSYVDEMLGGKAFHYDLHLNKLFREQTKQLAPGMRSDFKAFLGAQSTAVSRLVSSFNLQDSFSSFLSMKGLAAVPWVRTRHDAAIISRMWEIGRNTTLDGETRAAKLANMVASQFGFEIGTENHLISDVVKKVSKQLPGDKTAILSLDVMQRYMQFLLKKAGTNKEATEASMDALGSLQRRLFDRLGSGKIKSADQLLQEAISESTNISRSFLETVAAKEELKLAGFGGKTTAEAIEAGSTSFGRAWGQVHALRAAYASVKDPNDIEGLGRASFLRKLIQRRRSKGELQSRNFAAATAGLLEEDVFAGGKVRFSAEAGSSLPIEGDTEFLQALEKRGISEAKAQQSLMNREMAETGGKRAIKPGSLKETVEGLTAGASKLWKESPMFRLGVVGAGGLALLANARRIFAGSDDNELSAPPVESSAMIQNSLHRNPMVGIPDAEVQYPVGPNPVDFRQRAFLQRMSPAVQLGGTIRGSNAFSSVEEASLAMQSAGSNEGMISLVDSRRNHDITASFNARDIMNSDYTI